MCHINFIKKKLKPEIIALNSTLEGDLAKMFILECLLVYLYPFVFVQKRQEHSFVRNIHSNIFLKDVKNKEIQLRLRSYLTDIYDYKRNIWKKGVITGVYIPVWLFL